MSRCRAGLGTPGGVVSVLALLCVHCGSAQPHAEAGGNGGGGPGAAGQSGEQAGTGQASGGAASGGRASSGGRAGSAGSPGPAVDTTPGGPGCGFGDSPTFCDTFDAPSPQMGRAGELDSLDWSGARQQPQVPTGAGLAIGIIEGVIPSCRSGVPAHVFPDQDTLICDPNGAITSHHLLTAAAAQNYGQNSYRIRQPFDFAGRTGKIVFDGEAFTQQLLGWISLEISEDPTPGPSFALGSPGTANDEGSVVPRNAVQIQFANACNGHGDTPSAGISAIVVDTNYVQTANIPTDLVCMKTLQGSLNHIEVTLSQSRVEVFATDASPDGSSFGAPVLLYGLDLDLGFSRGYVSITTHNHATRKYSPENALSAWSARWDNVGFDGPPISNFREYEIPDSLTKATNAFNNNEAVTNIGYLVADVGSSPNPAVHFHGVDTSGQTKARLALSTWYLRGDATATYVLRYRFNGGAWHDRKLSADELTVLNDSRSQGAMGIIIEVAMSDLVSGDNSLEFQAENIPQNYPPVVSNIDLILSH